MFERLNNLPKLNSHVRFIHGCPDLGPINIYSEGKLLVGNLNFGGNTEYILLPSKEYEVEIFRSSDNTKPIATYKFEAIPNEFSTISLTCNNGTLFVLNLKDDSSEKDPKFSYIRFINISPNAPLLSLNLSNNRPIFSNVEFLEETRYYPLSPGLYNFNISFSSFTKARKRLPRINLLPGEKYTMYIIGLLNGKPEVGYILLKDG